MTPMSKIMHKFFIFTLFYTFLSNIVFAADVDEERFLHVYPKIGIAQIQMSFKTAKECNINAKNGFQEIKDLKLKCESEDFTPILFFFVKMLNPLSSTDPDEIRFGAPFSCNGMKNQLLALGKKENIDFTFYCGSKI